MYIYIFDILVYNGIYIFILFVDGHILNKIIYVLDLMSIYIYDKYVSSKNNNNLIFISLLCNFFIYCRVFNFYIYIYIETKNLTKNKKIINI